MVLSSIQNYEQKLKRTTMEWVETVAYSLLEQFFVNNYQKFRDLSKLSDITVFFGCNFSKNILSVMFTKFWYKFLVKINLLMECA